MSQTTLKHGSKGEAVTELQALLNQAGHPISVDGWFGDATEAAVRAYQAAQTPPLVTDGIAGAQTLATLRGQRSPQMLSQDAIAAAAELLGVEAAAVMAINRVEAAGRGFLSDGRIKILFERHIFYREVQKQHSAAVAAKWAREAPHICNKAPGGYNGGAAEYPRFSRAFIIDADCAMKACSWGAYQIMGFNHRQAGFKTVGEMVDAMKSGENTQLLAFAAFIKADKALHTALKNKDWPDFARRYNGPDYRKNAYHTKLADAYQHYAALYPANTEAV